MKYLRRERERSTSPRPVNSGLEDGVGAVMVGGVRVVVIIVVVTIVVVIMVVVIMVMGMAVVGVGVMVDLGVVIVSSPCISNSCSQPPVGVLASDEWYPGSGIRGCARLYNRIRQSK
eukprot:Rmarinus@m.18788